MPQTQINESRTDVGSAPRRKPITAVALQSFLSGSHKNDSATTECFSKIVLKLILHVSISDAVYLDAKR